MRTAVTAFFVGGMSCKCTGVISVCGLYLHRRGDHIQRWVCMPCPSMQLTHRLSPARELASRCRFSSEIKLVSDRAATNCTSAPSWTVRVGRLRPRRRVAVGFARPAAGVASRSPA